MESFYEWGQLNKNENYYYEAEVKPGDNFQINFTVSDSQSLYTYFDLYNFTDDLDLALYLNGDSKYLGDSISSSREEGTTEERIFKGLTPGDYILSIVHYEDIDKDNTNSKFRVDFNSTHFYQNSTVPNDTLFASQWHLLNSGQSGGIDDEDIRAPEAWNIVSRSPEVNIAIIDSGIQLNHPDLENNIWKNEGEVAGNNIDDDGNGYVDDISGWNFAQDIGVPYPSLHGTHVAGIIGAEGNNSKGISGVTWDVDLMSLDVFGKTNSTNDKDIISAIYYAANNGADVINISIGGLFRYDTITEYRLKRPNEYAKYFEALKYATDKGATVVIAAGNQDTDVRKQLALPAAFSSEIAGVISVAAVANTGDITGYSNYGSLVTIAAPGGDDNGSSGSSIISTAPNSRYKELSGTSMASPIVAGAAALVKAVNPKLRPIDIEDILSESADKYRELSYLVEEGNYLNLNDAVTLAQTYEPTKNIDSGSARVSVPTDKKWANRLWKWSGKDGIINIYIDTLGYYKTKSRTISKSQKSFYMDLFKEIEEAAGISIEISEISEIKQADIIIHSTGRKGAVKPKGSFYDINTAKTTTEKLNDRNREILASAVLTCFGLDYFRKKDEHEPDDSLMSYMFNESGYNGLTINDSFSLQSLW